MGKASQEWIILGKNIVYHIHCALWGVWWNWSPSCIDPRKLIKHVERNVLTSCSDYYYSFLLPEMTI